MAILVAIPIKTNPITDIIHIIVSDVLEKLLFETIKNMRIEANINAGIAFFLIFNSNPPKDYVSINIYIITYLYI